MTASYDWLGTEWTGVFLRDNNKTNNKIVATPESSRQCNALAWTSERPPWTSRDRCRLYPCPSQMPPGLVLHERNRTRFDSECGMEHRVYGRVYGVRCTGYGIKYKHITMQPRSFEGMEFVEVEWSNNNNDNNNYRDCQKQHPFHKRSKPYQDGLKKATTYNPTQLPHIGSKKARTKPANPQASWKKKEACHLYSIPFPKPITNKLNYFLTPLKKNPEPNPSNKSNPPFALSVKPSGGASLSRTSGVRSSDLTNWRIGTKLQRSTRPTSSPTARWVPRWLNWHTSGGASSSC